MTQQNIWLKMKSDLDEYPDGLHHFRSPCKESRIQATEQLLGEFPEILLQLLRLSNGAKLFEISGPMFTFFGITEEPPLSSKDWPSDWYIDVFTPSWRTDHQRENDWVIGIWNYGVLVAYSAQDQKVIEWETAYNCWGKVWNSLEEWIDQLLVEGEDFLAEARSDGVDC